MKSAVDTVKRWCFEVNVLLSRDNYKTLRAMILLGIVILEHGQITPAVAQGMSNSQAQFDQTLIQNSVGNLFLLIEGAFGALVMVVSGLGAIIAASMGAYRAAVGMLVVAVGSFILRSLVSLFFGTDFIEYEAGA